MLMLKYKADITRCILVLCMLLMSVGVYAQDVAGNGNSDSKNLTADVNDVVNGDQKKARFFESLTAGVDLVGPVMNSISGQGDFQAFLQANIKGKYLPVIELGYGKADKSSEITDIKYKTKAPFGRIGFDYNILKNKHDDYRLMVGLRYGITKFDYDTTWPTDSLHKEYTVTHDKCTLHWAEIVLGVDAKVWGPLHMGWSVRYRRRLSISDTVKDPLYAPGFGDASDFVQIMALYNICIQI